MPPHLSLELENGSAVRVHSLLALLTPFFLAPSLPPLSFSRSFVSFALSFRSCLPLAFRPFLSRSLEFSMLHCMYMYDVEF